MISNLEYYTRFTVAQLKARLLDFNATGISKMRKNELMSMLACLMDGAHLDAIHMSPVRIERKKLVTPRQRMIKRINGYMAANDTDKLTKAQSRRIRKKAHRHGINPWELTFTFP